MFLTSRNFALGSPVFRASACFHHRHDTIGRAPVAPVPAGVHYDLWLGPAPQHEFTKNRFHYNWHWFWDYGNGDIGNQGIHQMDVARWGLGVKYPSKISAMGGHMMFDDDQETPNVINATFEFDEGGRKRILVFEVRHWITNHEAGMGENGSSPNTVGTTTENTPASLAKSNSQGQRLRMPATIGRTSLPRFAAVSLPI
jgi:predicted dehydrogenase